jgi:S-adenosylmethionine synthetase
VELIYDLFPVKPNQIIEVFQLRNPIYAQTAAYGHFGNENFPWEKLDETIVAKLKVLALVK